MMRPLFLLLLFLVPLTLVSQSAPEPDSQDDSEPRVQGSQLRMPPGVGLYVTSDHKLGHGITTPDGWYHILQSGSHTTPHIRLTEDSKNYARVMFENTLYPGSWFLEGSGGGGGAATAEIGFYYTDASVSGYRMVITGDGRVGINEAAPQFKLDVRGSDNNSDGGELQLATPDETNFLRFFSGRRGDRNPFLAFAETDSFHIVSTSEDWSTYTRRITVLPSGNTGIGHDQPSGKLHILANSSTAFPQLRLTEDQTDFARIKMESSTQPGAFWDIAGRADTTETNARLNFYFRNDSTSGDRMTILGNGRVGIGTTSPDADLHIRALENAYLSIESDADYDAIIQLADANVPAVHSQWTIRRDGSDGGVLQWRHNNASRMTLTTGGLLGIGTSAPAADLHVKSPGFSRMTLESDAANDAVLQLSDANATGADDQWTIRRDGSDGGVLRWRHDNTSRMTLTTDGRLGIGTSSYAADLHLKAPGFAYMTIESDAANDAVLQFRDASAAGLEGHWTLRRDGSDGGVLRWRHDNTTRMTLTTDGKLGIGTHAPATTLDVTGGVKVDGSTFNVFPSTDQVTIGTTDPATGYALSVGGKIIAEEVRIQLESAPWPDYVFDEDYELMPLLALESSIAEHGHLPGFPDAATVDAEGFDSGEMQRKMIEKLEELTLYAIELQKQIDALQGQLDRVQK